MTERSEGIILLSGAGSRGQRAERRQGRSDQREERP